MKAEDYDALWNEYIRLRNQAVTAPSDAVAQGSLGRGSLPNSLPASECRIYEYDGAYRCFTHNKMWGAVSYPSEPCEGWSLKVKGKKK